MATLKKERKLAAKILRRATGLTLPDAGRVIQAFRTGAPIVGLDSPAKVKIWSLLRLSEEPQVSNCSSSDDGDRTEYYYEQVWRAPAKKGWSVEVRDRGYPVLYVEGDGFDSCIASGSGCEFDIAKYWRARKEGGQ